MTPTSLSPQKRITSMFGLALLCGLQPQQFPLPFEQVTEVHGPKANVISAISTLPTSETQSQSILEPKALPESVLEELSRKHATFTARVMARLSEAERREINTHLRQDYRQAWICVSFASKNSTQPFVESSYACYGVHPSKVWERILADRHERLGKEYYDWYDSADLLRPDVPKVSGRTAVGLADSSPQADTRLEPEVRTGVFVSLPERIPPSPAADVHAANRASLNGTGTGPIPLQPKDKERNI